MINFQESETTIRLSPIKKRSVPTKAAKTSRKKSGRFINCHNARRFRSARERWWFIAVSNCKAAKVHPAKLILSKKLEIILFKGIDLNYQLLMTNGPPGDYWREHFSADEFCMLLKTADILCILCESVADILPILMGFSIAYSFLMLGITVCSLELKQRQLLHTTYKIFVLSCVLQLFGILLMSIVYLKMAVSGRESPKTKRVGKNGTDYFFWMIEMELMIFLFQATCCLVLQKLVISCFCSC